MNAINLIIAKMDGYRECISAFDLFNCFCLDDEMRILRDYCENEEQFIEVLKVYDDGRYTLKSDGTFHDEENPSDSEEETDEEIVFKPKK